MQKNQKGFSFIEVMLVLIFLTLVGFVGWYVWDKKADDEVSPKSNNSSTSSPAAERQYLTIKEEGVKLELTDKINDAYYYVSKKGYIYISLKRYDDMKGFEGCRAQGVDGSDGNGLAALVSAKPGDDNFGSPWTEQGLEEAVRTRGAKIGDTYYWLEGSNQAPCYDINTIQESDQRVQDLSDLKTELVNQSKTITKAD